MAGKKQSHEIFCPNMELRFLRQAKSSAYRLGKCIILFRDIYYKTVSAPSYRLNVQARLGDHLIFGGLIYRKFKLSGFKGYRISPDIDIDDPKVILDRLGLLIDGQLTNGAILLFGLYPQKYFPNAVVWIGLFWDEAIISRSLKSKNL